MVVAQSKSDREQASLTGPVKSVETNAIDFTIKDGKTNPGKRQPWQSVIYNSAGNIVEQTTYDQSGNFLERLVYAYDSQGRSIGYDEYSAVSDKTSTSPRKHIYTINRLGNRTEYKVLESDGSLAIRFTYEYDAKARLPVPSARMKTIIDPSGRQARRDVIAIGDVAE